MSTALWLPLLVRVLTTAFIVVCASVTAEALGPVRGAIIACLPAATGPAYVFLALQHGPGFVAASALNSAAANAATGLFLIVYGALAGRIPPWRGLGMAVLAWFLASILIRLAGWNPGKVVLLNLAVYGPGFVLMAKAGTHAAGPARPAQRRWYDLPLRAAAVAIFVSVVVTISALLGPAATGIAAMFPISLLSLIIILLPRLGGAATARLALNALPPMLGYCVLLLAMYFAIPPWGVWPAFALALGISVLWPGILLAVQILRARVSPAARLPASAGR